MHWLLESAGPESDYRHFTVYPSVIEKIKSTRVIRVGTSSSFGSQVQFTYLDGTGGFKGFDMDLIQWVLEKLNSHPYLKSESGEKIKFEPRDLLFDDLLPKLKSYELDLVIASLTKTPEREKKYPGLKFTDGYLRAHQLFIQLGYGGTVPSSLKGSTVGVVLGTTNQKTAVNLSSPNKFNFKVKKFKNIDDVYSALKNRAIDFALVDDIYKGEFLPLGKDSDKHASPIESAYEEYAIALMDDQESKEQNLLGMINAILRSCEAKKKIEELKETYGVNNATKDRASKKCEPLTF